MQRLLLILLFLLSMQAFAQPYPTKIWDKRLGSYGEDKAYHCPIRKTSDGNLMLLAQINSFGGNLAIPGYGGMDYWFFKIDTTGNILWEKPLGGSGNEYARDFLELADGGFIICGSSGSLISGEKTAPLIGTQDMWIVRTDANMNPVWNKTYGGTYKDEVQSIVQTPDLGFILAGNTNSPKEFSVSQDPFSLNYDQDFWVVRIDSSGNKIWDKRYGWNQDDICHVILAMPDGNYILFGSTLSQNGGTISGTQRSTSDFWLVKIDGNGDIIWDKRFGSDPLSENENNFGAAVTNDGGFIFAGKSDGAVNNEKSEASKGGYDYWVIKCDSSGSIEWDRSLGGYGHEYFGDIIMLSSGEYLVSGMSSSPISGDKTQSNWLANSTNLWTVKLSSSGTKIWDVRFGGNKIEECNAVYELNNGKYIQYGHSKSDISGDKTENNWNLNPPFAPPSDLWLIAFNEPPLGYENLGNRENDIHVFPNPFIDLMEVGVEMKSAGSLVLELFDISGRSVFRQQYKLSTRFFNKEIDLSFLTPGVYSLTITTEKEREIRQIIKR